LSDDKIAIASRNAPAAIGPYSQAVSLGNLIFTSGQIPLDPATDAMVDGDIREQSIRVLENLKAVLAAAGLELRHVVKTTVFLKEMKDFVAMNEVYADDKAFPARSTVQVAALPKDALVEIDCIARRPKS